MDTNTTDTSTRQTAINSLAVIGFIALIALGVSLAVSSARCVPGAIDRIGVAAVSLSQIFTPGPEPTITVVPTASTTIPFGNATTTPTSTPTKIPTKKPVTTQPVTAGPTTSGTYPIDGSTGTPILSGLPDLVTSINAVGYLATTSAESFVASSTVPYGSRAAVTFTIKNVGTNATGAWRFSASIPTQSAYIYQSQLQQSLNPGDSIDYTLSFDQPNRGAGQMISVSANFDRVVIESNSNNNSAAASITILGS